MGGAAAINIATDDLAAFVDSIEGSKRRAREIIDYKTIVRRQEENAVRRARRVDDSGPPLDSCRYCRTGLCWSSPPDRSAR